jgi:TolA-binding protein
MKRGSLAVVACLLVACATAPEEQGTLKSLEREQVTIERNAAIAASREAAIQAYQNFLAAAPRDTLRPEAMRRVGDLALEGDPRGDGPKQAEYREAIKAYIQLLRGYPKFAGNDRVLYQLAHAYEQSGDPKAALETLDRLVAEFPKSSHRDEAEFRRGELLFSLREYPDAEQAYRTVLNRPDSPFYERALYMDGWSLFKQAKLDEALGSFFKVLDRKLIDAAGGAPKDPAALSRADRELTQDTFRVVSLSLANLKGAESIPAYTAAPGRRGYEYQVYRELANLYEKEERVKDAADALNSFARRFPTHPQAPLMQARVIEIYQKANFASLALEAKKEYVERYGVASAFRRANSAEAYAPVMKLVQTHLRDLARYYHAAAQKSKKATDYDEATRWYRTYLESFPDDPQAPAMNFLLAELLFESKHYPDAIVEYERTAYHYPRHEKTAEAGYAALLAYAAQEKQVPAEARKYRLAGAESALRFAYVNPQDPRTPRVLTDAAEKFYALHVPERAAAAAQRVLAIEPPVAPELRRTAWTVAAHTRFDAGSYDRAEAAYREALALTPADAPMRSALSERLAASIYKQGEQARAAGQLQMAAHHFLRVGQVVPTASIRATAQYDAAAAFIAMKDWNDAGQVLEDFRAKFPNHPLQADVPAKLAAVYLEGGQPLKAAAALETLAATKKDPAVSRDALWQAAELYEKAGRVQDAVRVYARYVQEYPVPLAPAVEARYRLVQIAEKHGQPADRLAWARSLVEAEKHGGGERNERTRYLGALCALILVEPLDREYRNVRLVEPLKQSLKLKKARMKELLDAYGAAADYGVAEVATAATYHTASVYQDFGKALLKSERPKGLKGEELEQYNVLLEEQAYPFEEKAIELHKINVRRLRDGIYDQWVKKSIASLGQLLPVQFAKSERGEEVIRVVH